MVYVRTKSVGGVKYAYIVKSVWDPDRGAPRQKIVKYLGRSSDVSPEDIPAEYAGEPKVREFVDCLTGAPAGPARDSDVLAGGLLDAMLSGDSATAARIRDECEAKRGIFSFYDRVLRPAMYRVGELWMDGRIGVGDEHVASNVAASLVRPAVQPKRPSGSVLICTPAGEEHSLGCAILESALSGRGTAVCNMAPSAPASEVVKFALEHKPDLILVSVTAPDNVMSARRLIEKIGMQARIPVVAGGQAAKSDELGCTVISEQSLDRTVRMIRAKVAESVAGRARGGPQAARHVLN